MDDKPTLPRGVEEVLVRYFRAADEGRPLRPEDLLAAYPHLASQLAEFFSGEEELRGLPRLKGSGAPTSPPGARLRGAEGTPDFGDLTPLEELGSGGMGIVYRVRDEQLGRDLAVKVLRSRYLRDGDMRRRFTEEARIGAQLQHPGVVPVHAFGTLPGDRPFFTMKLVRGRTFAALLGERSTPREELPRYLGIFGQVCRTVAYAHTHGVIHRDLKPANVMVGAFGEVQVMDWGLAKLLRAATPEPARIANQSDDTVTDDATPRTHTGEALGTLAYMPPEQARGAVREQDQRSDVFALGAMLCEVLTGEPPYTDATRDLLRQVRAGELTAALARLGACGADEELIQLARRCLAAEPSGRPCNAAEVAAVLQDYEDGLRERLRQTELERTAAAAREGEAVRTVRAERRARRRTVAVAVMLLVFLGSATAVAWHLERIRNQRDAEKAQQRSACERDFAREISAAEQLVRQGWQLQTAPERWREVLQSARTAFERAEGLYAESDGNDHLEQALRQNREALEEAERSQRLVAACERVRSQLTQTTGGNLNRAALAEGYSRAFGEFGLDLQHGDPAALAQRLGPHPLRELILDEFVNWLILKPDGTTAKRLQENVEALDPAPRSFRRRLWELVGRQDLAALRELARSEEAQRQSPTATGQLAITLMVTGRASVSRSERGQQAPPRDTRSLPSNYPGRTEALTLLRAACLRHPGDFWLHLNLVEVLDPRLDSERPEAILHATAAVALRPECAIAHLSLGIFLETNGEPDRAVVCYERALQLDPGEPHARCNLGSILAARHGYDAALAQFDKSLEATAGYVPALLGRGQVFLAQGKADEAITAYRRAVESEPTNHLAHHGLAWALHTRQQRREALAEARQAVALGAEQGQSHLLLAELLREEGALDEALAGYRRALELAGGLSRPQVAIAYYGLGLACFQKKDYPAALQALGVAAQMEPVFKSTLARVAAASSSSLEEKAAALRTAADTDAKDQGLQFELGRALQQLDRDDEALAAYRKGIALNDRSAYGHALVGSVLLKKHQVTESIEELNKAVALDPNLALAHLTLGSALAQKGDTARALEELRAGLKQAPDDLYGLTCLANLQEQTGDLNGALDTQRKLVTLDPRNVGFRVRLGVVLGKKGDFRGAEAEFQRVIDQEPGNQEAYLYLGGARANGRDLEGARRALEKAYEIKKTPVVLKCLCDVLMKQHAWREAAGRWQELERLDPNSAAFASAARADCLTTLGDLDAAVAAAREAVRMNPKLYPGHLNLGRALLAQRHEGEALEPLQKAAKLAPNDPETHFLLGWALQENRRFPEAVESFRRAVACAPASHPRRELFVQRVHACEAAIELQPRLAAILRGGEPPRGQLELLTLGMLCNAGEKRYPVASVRFYKVALTSWPQFNEEYLAPHRRQAAVAALHAAAGEGEDAGKLDEEVRTALRRQALEWVRANVETWNRVSARTAEADDHVPRSGILDLLLDPDLACVRDAAALAKLSDAERAEWEQTWKQANGLLAKLDRE